mmetsp:Transcript_4965/g.8008  ORF Transcript_4965/g.8008 Transcript_4965/m.8008 type:complete len:207 (+) Transcript_4965:184-804(+)
MTAVVTSPTLPCSAARLLRRRTAVASAVQCRRRARSPSVKWRSCCACTAWPRRGCRNSCAQPSTSRRTVAASPVRPTATARATTVSSRSTVVTGAAAAPVATRATAAASRAKRRSTAARRRVVPKRCCANKASLRGTATRRTAASAIATVCRPRVAAAVRSNNSPPKWRANPIAVRSASVSRHACRPVAAVRSLVRRVARRSTAAH